MPDRIGQSSLELSIGTQGRDRMPRRCRCCRLPLGSGWPQAAPQPSPGVQRRLSSRAAASQPQQPRSSRAAAEENPGLINEIGKLLEKSKSMLPTLKSPSETIDDLNAARQRRRREPVELGEAVVDGHRARGLPGCRQRRAGLQGGRRQALPEQGLSRKARASTPMRPRNARPKCTCRAANASRATARPKITSPARCASSSRKKRQNAILDTGKIALLV